MRNLKSYKIFELKTDPTFLELSVLTAEQRNWLDLRVVGKWYVNPDSKLVDIEGDFAARSTNLQDLRGVKFGEVTGSFMISFNQLTSLEGCPGEVGRTFNCDGNELKSLEGGPEIVGNSFSCFQNNLTTLEGAPISVGGNFDCSGNELISLKGSPKTVGGRFDCSLNRLTSLAGAPDEIGGRFDFSDNKITSFEGFSPRVYGGISCDNNPVSDGVLAMIFGLMLSKRTYKQAVEKYWPEIGDDDKVLLYRPDFEWVKPEEAKRIQALNKYNKIRDFI